MGLVDRVTNQLATSNTLTSQAVLLWQSNVAMDHFLEMEILMGKSFIWINYNALTATSLESWLVYKGNHPQMALIQVSEIL
jgi:hypothetical protein